jgi:hypothetical protein
MKTISALVFLMSLCVFAATGKQQPNSLGTVTYTANPYIYEAVNDIAGVNDVEGNLNLRVKPVGTYMLYDENILLCGMPIDKFQGVVSPFLMTYERQAHRAVAGVGCHNLLRVDPIQLRKDVQ